ncbi:MAG TPA: hypothetical protein VKR06_34575 [Ktedonosporobacter sp.]|nr:hypothetical protein [Ktedonosporobacter sp.]
MLSKDVELALAVLWREIAQEHFLRSLTIPEALAALEQRRDVADHLLAQIYREPAHSRCGDKAAFMLAHCRELLEAELAWLDRTISCLQSSIRAAP